MSNPTYETINYEVNADGLLLLTLNRPHNMNAFNLSMANELIAAFNHASTDNSVRVIVVTGAGEKAFCAGMDLSGEGNVFGIREDQKPTMQDVQNWQTCPAGVRDKGGEVSLAIFNCNKVVIGAVNGVAVGIGATMLLPMDFRFASNTAKFGFVFSKLGITAEACSTWFLPKLVGTAQALDWMLTGDIFTATHALKAGLVREVHQPDNLLPAAMQFASKIATTTSMVSVALNRRMLHLNASLPSPEAAHRIESLGMFYTSMADGKEGVQAFKEKRQPIYTSQVPADLPPFFEQI